MKPRATESKLGELHNKVASMMLKSLDQQDTAAALLEQYSSEDMPNDVYEFLEKASTPNPALLQACTKFLKDNDITCVIEENAEMSELERRLVNKRRSVSDMQIDIQ